MSDISFLTPAPESRRAPRPWARRMLRGLAVLLILAGALTLLDAVITLVWQEPITALYTTLRQDHLSGDLRKVERAQPTPAEVRTLASLADERARIAYLAGELRRHSRDGSAIGRIEIPRIGASFVLSKGRTPKISRAARACTPKAASPGSPARPRSRDIARPISRPSATSTTSSAATGSCCGCPTPSSSTRSPANSWWRRPTWKRRSARGLYASRPVGLHAPVQRCQTVAGVRHPRGHGARGRRPLAAGRGALAADQIPRAGAPTPAPPATTGARIPRAAGSRRSRLRSSRPAGRRSPRRSSSRLAALPAEGLLDAPAVLGGDAEAQLVVFAALAASCEGGTDSSAAPRRHRPRAAADRASTRRRTPLARAEVGGVGCEPVGEVDHRVDPRPRERATLGQPWHRPPGPRQRAARPASGPGAAASRRARHQPRRGVR